MVRLREEVQVKTSSTKYTLFCFRDHYKPGLLLHGGYFNMLESGWSRRHEENVLFLWYEEMKEDQQGAIRKIANHLEIAISDLEIEKLADFMTFDNYKKHSSLNVKTDNWHAGKGEVVRKGVVGDWVSHFSQELNSEYDEWIGRELTKLGIFDETIRGYFGLSSNN